MSFVTNLPDVCTTSRPFSLAISLQLNLKIKIKSKNQAGMIWTGGPPGIWAHSSVSGEELWAAASSWMHQASFTCICTERVGTSPRKINVCKWGQTEGYTRYQYIYHVRAHEINIHSVWGEGSLRWSNSPPLWLHMQCWGYDEAALGHDFNWNQIKKKGWQLWQWHILRLFFFLLHLRRFSQYDSAPAFAPSFSSWGIRF